VCGDKVLTAAGKVLTGAVQEVAGSMLLLVNENDSGFATEESRDEPTSPDPVMLAELRLDFSDWSSITGARNKCYKYPM
jgi:hypothetical protein